jgi:hypothetical protein
LVQSPRVAFIRFAGRAHPYLCLARRAAGMKPNQRTRLGVSRRDPPVAARGRGNQQGSIPHSRADQQRAPFPAVGQRPLASSGRTTLCQTKTYSKKPFASEPDRHRRGKHEKLALRGTRAPSPAQSGRFTGSLADQGPAALAGRCIRAQTEFAQQMLHVPRNIRSSPPFTADASQVAKADDDFHFPTCLHGIGRGRPHLPYEVALQSPNRTMRYLNRLGLKSEGRRKAGDQ